MEIGVDGCRAGWLMVARAPDGAFRREVFVDFANLIENAGGEAIIAVDMPIGLPDRIGRGGRGPEQAIRPLLGQRQSSVFSIPSRSAVQAGTYGEACAIALETSEPPRKVSRQGFHLFPRIRELDSILTPQLQERVREVHPELAFCILNGGRPMATPKKIRGSVNPAGIAERKALLEACGVPAAFLSLPPPRGAAQDDFLDACVCCVVAGRIANGTAKSYPVNPARDARGLTIAIWA